MFVLEESIIYEVTPFPGFLSRVLEHKIPRYRLHEGRGVQGGFGHVVRLNYLNGEPSDKVIKFFKDEMYTTPDTLIKPRSPSEPGHQHPLPTNQPARRHHSTPYPERQRMPLSATPEIENEIRLASRLHAKRVETGGTPAIIMDSLPGEVVELDQRKYNFEHAVSVATQVSHQLLDLALEGTIHHDIAPKNIIVTKNPEQEPFALVVDYGLAQHHPQLRYTSANRFKDGSLFDLTHVAQRSGGGTPGFVAPEKFGKQYRQIGVRADTYSLAVTFSVLFNCTQERVVPTLSSLGNEPCFRQSRKPAQYGIIDFLKRARDKDPLQRPDPEEFFEFFAYLQQLLMLEKQLHQADYNRTGRSAALLAQWDFVRAQLNLLRTGMYRYRAAQDSLPLTSYLQKNKATAPFFRKAITYVELNDLDLVRQWYRLVAKIAYQARQQEHFLLSENVPTLYEAFTADLRGERIAHDNPCLYTFLQTKSSRELFHSVQQQRDLGNKDFAKDCLPNLIAMPARKFLNAHYSAATPNSIPTPDEGPFYFLFRLSILDAQTPQSMLENQTESAALDAYSRQHPEFATIMALTRISLGAAAPTSQADPDILSRSASALPRPGGGG